MSGCEKPEHYNGLYGYLKSRKMGAAFLVDGSMEVVREVIAGITVYNANIYIHYGDLEVALPLAFKEDHHVVLSSSSWQGKQELRRRINSANKKDSDKF